MRVIRSQRQMFVAQFAATTEERRDLLDYLDWLEAQDAARGDGRGYGESAFWTELTSETAVGFSRDRVVLQSGHALADARLTVPRQATRVPALLHQLLTALRRRPPEPLADFRRYHPDAPLDQAALDLNPGAYLRSVEALTAAAESIDIPAVRTFLEIGAGAGTTIHAVLERAPQARAVVIDLPESIPVAYLCLKTLRPDLRIALPHSDVQPLDVDHDVTFRHPDQMTAVPQGTFDMVFNMSSFQEMSLAVVNDYLQQASQWLRPGGALVSVNHKVSRYITDNRMDAWWREGFATVEDRTALPWHDTHARSYGCEMVLRIATVPAEDMAGAVP